MRFVRWHFVASRFRHLSIARCAALRALMAEVFLHCMTPSPDAEMNRYDSIKIMLAWEMCCRFSSPS